VGWGADASCASNCIWQLPEYIREKKVRPGFALVQKRHECLQVNKNRIKWDLALLCWVFWVFLSEGIISIFEDKQQTKKKLFPSGPFFAQITKSISEDIEKEEEDGPRKRPARFLEDDEGLEKTRKNLNEKIAQLNAAIDDVSAQLRSEDGFGNPNETTAELESAAWWILRGGRKSYLILTAVWCAAMRASLSIVVQQWAWKHQCTPHGYRFFC
jgi:hypothetical protein